MSGFNCISLVLKSEKDTVRLNSAHTRGPRNEGAGERAREKEKEKKGERGPVAVRRERALGPHEIGPHRSLAARRAAEMIRPPIYYF